LLALASLLMPQVFNLPIEEAAKHLGIGQTLLKHYCNLLYRTLMLQLPAV
jgi:hypothetical protein